MAADRFRLAPGQERELRKRFWKEVEVPDDLENDVTNIIRAIKGPSREDRDEALLELRRRFEGELAPATTRIEPERIQAALDNINADLRASLELAARNIREVAEAELAPDVARSMPEGHEITIRNVPINVAGVYVPGGTAAYPSSVLMCCVPARVAGVNRIVIASPVDMHGRPHEAVLAAAAVAGVDEMHAMGGAHAIAAMAFGTGTITQADIVVGPGNFYVREAKRQVFGVVGIDGLAGPSEVIVIADKTADPRLVALDLAAQAEHGISSPVLLIGSDPDALTEIDVAYTDVLRKHPSFAMNQLVIIDSSTLDSTLAFVDEMAPEHLELHCADPEQVASRVGAAGAVFYGEGASAVFGDYVAGSNHVLPTARAARFSGPLSSNTFRRRQALVSLPADAASALAPHAARIARAEGLPIHAESAEARAKDPS